MNKRKNCELCMVFQCFVGPTSATQGVDRSILSNSIGAELVEEGKEILYERLESGVLDVLDVDAEEEGTATLAPKSQADGEDVDGFRGDFIRQVYARDKRAVFLSGM